MKRSAPGTLPSPFSLGKRAGSNQALYSMVLLLGIVACLFVVYALGTAGISGGGQFFSAKAFTDWGKNYVPAFSAGVSVIFFFYSSAHFFRSNNEVALYSAATSLLWMAFTLTLPQVHLVDHFGDGGGLERALAYINVVCVVLSVPLGYLQLRAAFADQFNKKYSIALLAAAFIFAASCLVLPQGIFETSSVVYHSVMSVVLIYMVYGLFKAMMNHRPGAFCLFTGYLVFGVTYPAFLGSFVKSESFTLILLGGVLILLFCQQAFFSLLSANSSREVKKLSKDLAEKDLLLEEERKELMKLRCDLVDVCEEERCRIGQDLHDGLCQLLIGLRLHLTPLKAAIKSGSNNESSFDTCTRLLEDSINSAYSLSNSLLSVEGKSAKTFMPLQEFIRRTKKTSGVDIKLAQKFGCHSCPNKALNQIYRIAQEAVNNAIKHADPNMITVNINCEDRNSITLRVTNDQRRSKNESVSIGGFGRGIMMDRAKIINGELTFTENEDNQVVVSCIAPCAVFEKV